ncbi:hypothetical protein BUALT_Bualt06G0030100 [Buddleja alternifolia]|uniref:Uncharacterized protein n=1 Tax=Buddleja alternifolia TaxID=168488 RepID=A0AAV6XDR2_9LAMI|nr:hypothetical protein BUALT_Bualt06G0030100 [Buddleja alternifolia]
MISSAENKICTICLGRVATGQGQAIFTAECSHSFHSGCIGNYIRNGNSHCPICLSKWNNFPFTFPISNTNGNVNHNNLYPVFPTPQVPPLFSQVPPPLFPPRPSFEPEPLHFSDDEPLLDPMSCDSVVGLQNVSIKAVPERPAVAASEFISHFAVLVGLKAPSLSNDARLSQRAPIDLVTVLDISGSMDGPKLALLKRAVIFVIDNLGASDRLSIVSFENHARRVLSLRRMTNSGREDAKRAVNSLLANGGTNIVKGLEKGVRVLEERRQKNPVTSIIFLSDGNDNCNNHGTQFANFSYQRKAPSYLHLLPSSICPHNRGMGDRGHEQTFPVHAFGFGSDHDPLAMHAISDASGGTFSFIESYEMVQDAFASCIGGLLSVVAQEICLSVRSASNGVGIRSIPSGRYASEISNQGSEGIVRAGDLYADEEKGFLINLSIPMLPDDKGEESEKKTSLLDVMCSYRDVVSKEVVKIECDLVEIRRPISLSHEDMMINLEVDRQRNRLLAAEKITQAQQMAESGNLTGAQALLSKGRTDLLASASAQAGDGLCMWLQADMKETEIRMGSQQMYQQSGRAFALSGMSSHASQRATTKGKTVAGAAAGAVESFIFGSAPQASAAPNVAFGGYATPQMASMVTKSQQLKKT